MGIGQSVDDPASTSLLGDYYPSRLRARAFSLQQISLFVGGGIGLALGGYVGTTLGWRWAFALVGMPGSVVALLAFRLREPVRGESDLPEGATVEAADPQDDQSLGQFARRARAELGSELRMIFGIRTMRYILVGVAALLFTVSGIGYWLAVYHQRYSDMSVGEATAFTALVLGVGGGIGTLVGGIASDRLHRRVTGGRILLVVWSSVACALLFLVSFSIQPVPLRLALQFFGVMAAAGAVPGLRASMLDVVPAESRGVGASAFALTAAVFGTALAPPLVGLLSDLTSLVGAFYIVFPPVILGLLLLLRARHTVDADADALVAALVARSSAAAG